jgi:hypothetical protein
MSYTTFFYDKQIRRFLTQFIRIMSNFQVQINTEQNGTPVYQRVPVFYGDASRQASQILRGNSENSIKSVPAMAVHISALRYDRDRVQEPNFVSKMNIRTKQYDAASGQYTDQPGGTYTVERLMPVPYRLTLKVDVWTSNTEQKLMLLEQIMLLFNPAMEIQSTDNYIDWTSLSYVLLTDIDWTNRSVPTGTEDTIDISSLAFELPIWVSAPAKVKELGVIRRIVSSLYDSDGNFEDDIFRELNPISSQHFTFASYGVIYRDNYLKLLKQNEINATDIEVSFDINIKQRHSWQALISQFGGINSGSSKIRLLQENGSDLVGTIAYHPADETLLLFTPFPDTIPTNTLQPISAIINPQTIDVNSNLLSPAAGTRYLLLHGIGNYGDTEVAPAWNSPRYTPLVANTNDIIEFNGVYWVVVFDSENRTNLEYVTNLTTNTQYKWSNRAWTKSVEGRYTAANWSLTL